MLKHTESDRTLQQVCIVQCYFINHLTSFLGSYSRSLICPGKPDFKYHRYDLDLIHTQLQHLPSSTNILGAERDIALARQFFDANASPQGAGSSFSVPQHLPPSSMQAPRFASPDLNVAWVESQQRQFLQSQVPSDLKSQNWAGEFGNSSQVHSPGPAMQQNASQRSDSTLLPLPTLLNTLLTFLAISVPVFVYATKNVWRQPWNGNVFGYAAPGSGNR